MRDVLIVCKGNICRSPMAVAILRDMIAKRGLAEEVRVRSAGIWASEDQAATPEAQKVMRERGLDISDHRAHLLTIADIARADIIVTMEATIAEAILIEAPWAAGKVHNLGDLADEPGDVEDPMGRGIDAYRRAADTLLAMLQRAYCRIVD